MGREVSGLGAGGIFLDALFTSTAWRNLISKIWNEIDFWLRELDWLSFVLSHANSIVP